MQAIITITGKVLHDPFKNESNIKGCIYYIGKKKGKAIEHAHHIIHSFIHSFINFKKATLTIAFGKCQQ